MEMMFRLFLFVSATFLPECVSLMMRAVTPADTDTIADRKERRCPENKEKEGFISITVWALREVPVPQKYKFPWGRRVLRYVRSQTLSGEERMGDPGGKLLGWGAQNLGSTPRGRKRSHPCHEIQFSALNTLQCFKNLAASF